MATQQQLANYIQTTLASGCTNSAGTISVVSAAGLPTTGNFMLRIDDPAPATTFEYVECTAVSGTTLTVTRGQEGTTGIAHSAGAFVGNDLTSAMLIRSFAQGKLPGGYASVVANQTGITTVTDLTGLSVTVTIPANRTLKITGLVFTQQQTTAAPELLSIQEGATVIQQVNNSVGAGSNFTGIVEAIITPSAGSHTYKLTLSTSSGSVNVLASATSPAWILVEDIGQA